MLEAELMERDRWTRDDLLAHQAERVRALLTHAVSRSPYYREVLGADAAERPLAELPTLSKATLMAEFDRIVTDPQLRLADLRAHLASADPSQSFLGAYRVATTSGTTGRRSIVAFTHDEAAAWRAASARPMMRTGIGFGPRFAALGSPSPVHVTRQVLVPPGVPDASDFGRDTGSRTGRSTERPTTRGPRRCGRDLEGARRGADRRSPPDRSTRGFLQQRAANGRRPATRPGGLGNRAGERLRRDRGAHDRREQSGTPGAGDRRGRRGDRDR